jgi:hypothetical protein
MALALYWMTCTDVFVGTMMRASVPQMCGLCEKKEGCCTASKELEEKGAHQICIDKTDGPRRHLIETINVIFSSESNYNKHEAALYGAVKAVKLECRPLTIIGYLDAHGEQRLTELFNTVGVEAAKKCAAGFHKAKW